MEDEISIRDAQELLGVTKATIYNLIRRGELHPRKKKVGSGLGGRRVWLSRAEVVTLKGADVEVDTGKRSRKK